MIAEQTVIGWMMANPAAAWEIRPKLRPEYFTDAWLRSIFTTVSSLMDEGKTLTKLAVAARLGHERDDGEDIQVLLSTYAGMGREVVVTDFVSELVDAWRKRSFAETLKHVGKQVAKVGVDEAMALLVPALDDLANASTSKPVSLQELTADILRQSVHVQETGIVPGFQTGLQALDDVLGPMMPGDLVVIGGPPGGGKTVLGAQILGGISYSGATLLVELEMSGKQIASRFLSAASGLTVRQIGSQLDMIQMNELRSADFLLQNSKVDIWADAGITLSQISQYAAYMARTKKLKAMVVDHFALVNLDPGVKVTDKWGRFDIIARGLKKIALDNGLLMILLSQVTKESQKADKGVPMLRDLDGGGALERQADQAIIIFDRAAWILENHLNGQKPDRYADDKTKWMMQYFNAEYKTELHVVKNRSGQRGGKAFVRFKGGQNRFEDINTID